MVSPNVSIIIPCEGREALVERLLQTLERARSETPCPVEVILVDSSTGEARAILESYCERYGASYVEGPRNVRRKRNLGAKLAGGEILLFLDSDCAAKKDLINRHLAGYAATADGEIAGVVGITEFVGPETWVTRLAETSPFTDAFSFARNMPYVAWATASNVSFRRDIFWQTGGFDAQLPFKLGGDDLDLSWRITLAGYLLKAEPEAIVFHSRETWASLRAFTSRVWRWGRIEHHLKRKHSGRLKPLFPPLWIWAALSFSLMAASSRYGPAELTRRLTAFGTFCLLGSAASELWNRRGLPLRRWPYIPGVLLIMGIYRAGAWFEMVYRRRIAHPFQKLYFDSWHLRAESESQAVAAWIVLLAAIVSSALV